jgi:hypothetical protein
MGELWNPAAAGVLRLPSGRLVRGRGIGRAFAAGSPASPDTPPEFGVYLLGSDPPEVPWESRWLCWPDFGLPADRAQAARTLAEAWRRSEHERVEVACAGGRGRTGTALACLAVLDGVPGHQVVATSARTMTRARSRLHGNADSWRDLHRRRSLRGPVA